MHPLTPCVQLRLGVNMEAFETVWPEAGICLLQKPRQPAAVDIDRFNGYHAKECLDWQRRLV